MPVSLRQLGAVLRALILASLVALIPAGRALASKHQDAMFQDDGRMMVDPAGTLQQLRLLGVDACARP